MRERVRLLALVVLLVPAWAHASAPCGNGAGELVAEEGIGGTGRDEPLLEGGDGIAGTGRTEGGDGIGGTGRAEGADGIGGTGLFGTLTSFAPLCVNGQAIALDPATAVFADGRDATVDRLRVGQLLWVVGPVADGVLQAERIDVLFAERGAIEAVELRRRRFRVGSSWVTLLDQALVVDQSTGLILDPRGLRVGEVVEVSALRDLEGRLFASRVDRIAAQAGGVRVAPAGLPAVAELVRRSPVGALVVEGFLGRDAAGGFTLGALALDTSALAPSALAALTAESRVWVRGAASAASLRASRVVLPPPAVRAPTPQPLPNLPGLPRPGLVRPSAPPGAPRTERPAGRPTPPPPAPAPPRGIEPGQGPTRIEPDVRPAPVPRAPTRVR